MAHPIGVIRSREVNYSARETLARKIGSRLPQPRWSIQESKKYQFLVSRAGRFGPTTPENFAYPRCERVIAGDAPLLRPKNRGRAAVDADPTVERSYMIAHRVVRQAQRVTHGLIVLTCTDQPQHLAFSLGQLIQSVYLRFGVGSSIYRAKLLQNGTTGGRAIRDSGLDDRHKAAVGTALLRDISQDTQDFALGIDEVESFRQCDQEALRFLVLG